MGSPEGKSIISNPVAIHDSNNQTFVFCLCDDGQVYFLKQEADGTALEFGKWLSISAKIPFEAGIQHYNIDITSLSKPKMVVKGEPLKSLGNSHERED